MKKLITLLLALISIFALFACNDNGGDQGGNETPTLLSQPENILVKRNILTFDEVTDATKYRLKISQDGEFLQNLFVTSGYDLSTMLEDGEYTATLEALNDTKQGEKSAVFNIHIGYEKIPVTELKELKELDLCDSTCINLSGRTFYDESKKRLYFYYSASGFKVSFTGTELKGTFYAEQKGSTANIKAAARIVVLVDGEVYPDGGTTIALNINKSTKEYTLCSGLTNGTHTVEVLKRTESADNNTALVNLKTDGFFANPQADKTKRILLIGASGSTGYGNIAKVTESSQTPQNSDCMRAFPYLVSRMYDTEIDEVNASGWGVLWGWNDQSGQNNIPKAFGKLAIKQSNSVAKEDYDYTKDSYDLIIVNLGMNDFNAKIKSITDATTKASDINKYKAAVKAFYELLCSTYDCPIIIIHTSNTDQNAEGIYNEAMAAEVNTALGKDRIFPLIIPANGASYKGVSTGIGANSHANVQTHIWTADIISEWIGENMDWTKVRNNITYNKTRDTAEINLQQ